MRRKRMPESLVSWTKRSRATTTSSCIRGLEHGIRSYQHGSVLLCEYGSHGCNNSVHIHLLEHVIIYCCSLHQVNHSHSSFEMLDLLW